MTLFYNNKIFFLFFLRFNKKRSNFYMIAPFEIFNYISLLTRVQLSRFAVWVQTKLL